MREATYEHEITSIKQHGNALIIQDAPFDADKRVTFANHLMQNAVQKKMALSAFTCEEPFAFFHDTLVDMLEGTTTRIDLLWVKLKPVAKRVIVQKSDGDMRDSNLSPHTVARITSSNGFVWIIDVTGPQYGILRICWPENVYMRQHALKVEKTVDISEHKAEYKNALAMYPHVQAAWGATERIESMVSAWKSGTGLTLATLLQQPDKFFQYNRNKLIEYTKKALDGFVADRSASKNTGTMTLDDLMTIKDHQKVTHLFPMFEQDSPFEQSLTKLVEQLNSASVETGKHKQGGCSGDENSALDNENDEDNHCGEE